MACCQTIFKEAQNIMDVTLKVNQQVKPVIDVEAGIVNFHVKGFNEPLTLHLDKLHPSIIRRAALAGMAQVRIVDAAAISAQDDDGNIIPIDDRAIIKYGNMKGLIDHYETGTDQWTVTGSGGGARSITIEAIARVQNVDYDTAVKMVDAHAEKKYDGNRKKALAKLRGAADVIRAMQEIRAERIPTAKVDANAELAELIAE
jgi:hypothetical protein